MRQIYSIYIIFDNKKGEIFFFKQMTDIQIFGIKKYTANRKFFRSIRKKASVLDRYFHALHHQISKDIDCLSCDNCCKTIGPRIYAKDIARMAVYVKMKESVFFHKYIKTETDGSYGFLQSPYLYN